MKQAPHFYVIATAAWVKYYGLRPYGKNICVPNNWSVLINPVILFNPNKDTVAFNINIAIM